MKTIAHLSMLALTATFLFAAGCSGEAADAGDDDGSEPEGSSESAISKSLPPPILEYKEKQTLFVGTCKFIIGTAQQAGPPWPPQYYAWVWRGPSGGPCAGSIGYQILGYSYAEPNVSIAKHPLLPRIVASYTSKPSPSGSGAISAVIKSLKFGDLSTLKSATLAAMGSPPMTAGYVYSANLSVTFGGTLVVTGTASGVFPGQTGSGPNYQAKYASWFSSPATAPTSVVRY